MRCQRGQRCITWKKTCPVRWKKVGIQIRSNHFNWGLSLWRNFWYMFTWNTSWYLICHESWCLKMFDLNWTEAQAVPSPRPGARTLPRSGRTHGRKSLGANPTHPTWKIEASRSGKSSTGQNWVLMLHLPIQNANSQKWKDDPKWFYGSGLVFMILSWSFDFPFSCWLSSVLKSVNVRHMSFCNEVPLITPFFGDSWQCCQRTPMLCGLLSTHHCQ